MNRWRGDWPKFIEFGEIKVLGSGK